MASTSMFLFCDLIFNFLFFFRRFSFYRFARTHAAVLQICEHILHKVKYAQADHNQQCNLRIVSKGKHQNNLCCREKLIQFKKKNVQSKSCAWASDHRIYYTSKNICISDQDQKCCNNRFTLNLIVTGAISGCIRRACCSMFIYQELTMDWGMIAAASVVSIDALVTTATNNSTFINR